MARPPTVTREKILAAAFARFSHYGFRRTSMEDIAAQAGVSRAALYLQFRNKEEIFRSLSRELHEQTMADAAAVLEGDAPLAERLRLAVEAKSVRFVELANSSPHAGELLDERDRLCGDLPAESERQFRGRWRASFAARPCGRDRSGCGRLTAAEAAEVFARSTSGSRVPASRSNATGGSWAPWFGSSSPAWRSSRSANRRPAGDDRRAVWDDREHGRARRAPHARRAALGRPAAHRTNTVATQPRHRLEFAPASP